MKISIAATGVAAILAISPFASVSAEENLAVEPLVMQTEVMMSMEAIPLPPQRPPVLRRPRIVQAAAAPVVALRALPERRIPQIWMSVGTGF